MRSHAIPFSITLPMLHWPALRWMVLNLLLLSVVLRVLLLSPSVCAEGLWTPSVLYVANLSANSVSTFQIPPNGWPYLQATVPADQVPRALAVHPSGRFVYVRNQGAQDILTYDVDRRGQLTIHPVLVPPTIFSDAALSLAIHPSGASLYVPRYLDLVPPTTSRLARFAIDGQGTLLYIDEFQTDAVPRVAAVAPSGAFLYLTYQGSPADEGVSMYQTAPTTGRVLAYLGTVPAGAAPEGITVHPSGRFAYVANRGTNDVSVYTIDERSGVLREQGRVAAGAAPLAITVHPSGRFVYAVNHDDGTVSQFAVDAMTGWLTPQGDVAAHTHPYALAFEPTGQFAYAVNISSNDLAVYTADRLTGLLTLQGFVEAGPGPVAVAVLALPADTATVQDLNGDGKADLVWRHTSTGQVNVWTMNGTQVQGSGSPGTVSDLAWHIVGVQDVDGDGKADVVWHNSTTGMVWVWLMEGTVIRDGGSPGTVSDLAWQIQP